MLLWAHMQYINEIYFQRALLRQIWFCWWRQGLQQATPLLGQWHVSAINGAVQLLVIYWSILYCTSLPCCLAIEFELIAYNLLFYFLLFHRPCKCCSSSFDCWSRDFTFGYAYTWGQLAVVLLQLGTWNLIHYWLRSVISSRLCMF